MFRETNGIQEKEHSIDWTEKFFEVLRSNEDSMIFYTLVDSIRKDCESGKSVRVQIDLKDDQVNEEMTRDNWTTLDMLYDRLGNEENFSIEIITDKQEKDLILEIGGKKFKGFRTRAVSIKSEE